MHKTNINNNKTCVIIECKQKRGEKVHLSACKSIRKILARINMETKRANFIMHPTRKYQPLPARNLTSFIVCSFPTVISNAINKGNNFTSETDLSDLSMSRELETCSLLYFRINIAFDMGHCFLG